MPHLVQFPAGIVDRDKQLLELYRTDYEDSLYAFLKAAWPYVDPAPWRDGWCIGALAEHLQAVVDGEIKRLVVNIPPRTSKTSLCSIALAPWTWAQRDHTATAGPGVRFMYASYGDTLSCDHSAASRRLIKSEWYQGLWGDRYSLLADQDTKHKFMNDKGGERQVTSIDGRVTGRGGQVIVIDDPNATNDAGSEAKIEAVKNWWDQTMASRLNDRKTGAFILVQQRVSEDDLSGYLLEKTVGDWQHLVLPMRFEADRRSTTSIGWKDPRTTEGELLWPERFDAADVMDIEKESGPWVFAGQYQQRPEPRGGGIIKREWWQTWADLRACEHRGRHGDAPPMRMLSDCPMQTGGPPCRECPAPLSVFPPMDFVLAYLDTAYTEKTENDYSALIVWGVFSIDTVAQASGMIGVDGKVIRFDRNYADLTPKVMMMNAWQERLPLHELVQKTAKTCKDLKVDKLLIENKAAGISVGQEIRRLYGFENFGVQLDDPKSLDKVSRLYSVQHLFAEGLVWAPDKAWADMVISQVGTFPHGRHDDLVDCTSGSLRHIRDIGLLTRSAERVAEMEEAKRYVKAPGPLYPA